MTAVLAFHRKPACASPKNGLIEAFLLTFVSAVLSMTPLPAAELFSWVQALSSGTPVF